LLLELAAAAAAAFAPETDQILLFLGLVYLL
jgi:hypothetical protein